MKKIRQKKRHQERPQDLRRCICMIRQKIRRIEQLQTELSDIKEALSETCDMLLGDGKREQGWECHASQPPRFRNTRKILKISPISERDIAEWIAREDEPGAYGGYSDFPLAVDLL